LKGKEPYYSLPFKGKSVVEINKVKIISPADLGGQAVSEMFSEAKLSYFLFVTGHV
jgi:hypothetical protein